MERLQRLVALKAELRVRQEDVATLRHDIKAAERALFGLAHEDGRQTLLLVNE
jgi:hypothetical protein